VESKRGPLGTSATDWPIVPAPGDYDDGEFGGMKIVQGKPKYSETTCPRATLSITNPTWPYPGSNPGRRGGKPATKGLSYGAANLYLTEISQVIFSRFLAFSTSVAYLLPYNPLFFFFFVVVFWRNSVPHFTSYPCFQATIKMSMDVDCPLCIPSHS
jgi:hypothetical protein